MVTRYKPLHFYVYALFRPNGVVFWIGKGKGNRWLTHERYPNKKKPSHKDRIILKVKQLGQQITRVKLFEGLSEAEAFATERELIRAIGRKPNGPLVNYTDGGEGATNPPPWVRETIARSNARRLATPGVQEFMQKRKREVGPSEAQRQAASKLCKQRNKDPAFALKVSAGLKGKPKAPEHVAKAVETRMSNLPSEAELARRVNMCDYWVDRKHKEESKLAIGRAHKNRKKSPEQIAKWLKSMRENYWSSDPTMISKRSIAAKTRKQNRKRNINGTFV